MISNENKQALYWTAGFVGVIVVVAIVAYVVGWPASVE